MESEESSFILTDDELSSISSMNIQKIDSLIREKKNSKLYHRFFINSIFSVKKASSQYTLLLYLQNKLECGSYFIPIHDTKVLFRILFKDLPNHDNFSTNSENMELLFKCMTLFIIIFYRTLYPYFFDIDNDESLFSYNTNFIIDFLINFCLYLNLKQNAYSIRDFLDLLQSDGSITNIMDYLFDFFIDGIEYSRISTFFYTLFSLINPDFILDYIDQKNLLTKSPAVCINHRKKIILLTYYQIPFFMNYIQNKYEIKFDHELRVELNRTFSEDDKKKFNKTISDFHIYEYLESFLFNYTEQLISEGRLINVSNPFKSDQIGIQTKSYTFYPEKANDFYSSIIIKFLFFLSDIMVKADMQETLLYFYPIISFSFKISYMSSFKEYATYHLFNYLKRSNLNKFDDLKNILIETIKNRIIGNFKYDYEFLNKHNCIVFDDKVYQLNYYNYNATYYFIAALNEQIKDCDEILNLLHSDDIEVIKKIFNVFSYASANNSFCISLLKHYNDYITKPGIAINTIKILSSFGIANYKYVTKQIKEITKFILKEQNITDNINQKKILSLYEVLNIHYKSLFSDIFEEEEEENDIFNAIIENCDVLRIKIFMDLLNRQKLINYLHRASRYFLKKLSETEKLNENVIQCIILLSGFLVCFKIQNERVFKNIKCCISYLDNKQEECQIINGHMIELKSSNDNAKLYLIFLLTNSYGFLLYEEYLNLISSFIEKYGMCIELLSIISNIIEYLVPFIDERSISDECLLKTNENIFKIVQILIDNSVENDDGKNSEKAKTNSFKTYSSSKTTVLHFSLLKNNKKCNYYISYRMSGKKVDEKFGYEVKNIYLDILKNEYCDSIANSFISNISDYANAMITNFGDTINIFDLFKKTIDFASEFKNQLNSTES